MKKYLLTVTVLFCFTIPAFAAKGIVVLRKRGCDYFLVKTTNDDYALLEWYGGYDPEKGDIIVGSFESYGMQDLVCTTADEELSVWVEDYQLSRSSAIEQFYEQCE